MNDRSSGRPRSASQDRLRMDVVSVARLVDEVTGEYEFGVAPDPERYDLIEHEGMPAYFDKFDATIMTVELAMDMIRRAFALTPVVQPPNIADAAVYVGSRRSEIDAVLEGHETAPTFVDRSEEFLRSLAEKELGFVVMFVDLVGSTRLSQQLSPEDNARLIRVFLREVGATIGHFNGLVLKHVGDAVVAYFPEPSFVAKNDLALDCALSIRLLVADGLNPALTAHGLPAVNVRIGLEAGDARVETVGAPDVKEHRDLLGFVINVAAKIQALAPPGDIFVGEVSERNLHVRWRQILQPIELPETWPFAVRVFRVVPGSKRERA